MAWDKQRAGERASSLTRVSVVRDLGRPVLGCTLRDEEVGAAVGHPTKEAPENYGRAAEHGWKLG